MLVAALMAVAAAPAFTAVLVAFFATEDGLSLFTTVSFLEGALVIGFGAAFGLGSAFGFSCFFTAGAAFAFAGFGFCAAGFAAGALVAAAGFAPLGTGSSIPAGAEPCVPDAALLCNLNGFADDGDDADFLGVEVVLPWVLFFVAAAGFEGETEVLPFPAYDTAGADEGFALRFKADTFPSF